MIPKITQEQIFEMEMLNHSLRTRENREPEDLLGDFYEITREQPVLKPT